MRKSIVWIFLLLGCVASLPGSWASENAKAPELSIEEHLIKLSKEKIEDRWTHPSMKALQGQGAKSVPLLSQALREKDSFGQKLYRMVYTNVPSTVADKFSPPRTQELTDIRVTAAQALAVIGPKAKPAIPDLIASIGDLHARNLAFYALMEIGPRDEDASALIGLIRRSQDSVIRGYMAQCLALTRPTKETLEVLKSCIEDPDAVIHRFGVGAVASLTNQAEVFLPSLSKRLEDEDSLTQISAAQSIWNMTSRTNEIFPSIERGLMKGETSRPASQNWMSQDDITLYWTVELAGQIGKQATSLVYLIEKLSESSEPQIRFSATKSIWKITGRTNAVLATGRALLSHYDLAVRSNAAKTLAEFCLEQRLEEPLQDSLLRHQDISVRIYGISALWKLKGFDEAFVPILIKGVQDHYTYHIHRELREISATILGEIGPRATAAIPALELAIDDGEPKVEAAARVALSKIKASQN